MVDRPTRDKLFAVVPLAIAMKAAMLDAGETSAEAECPECGGTFRARLAGPRNHVRGACEKPGCLRFIE